MYKIWDSQACQYFSDDEEFKTKTDCLDRLVSFHSIDFDYTDYTKLNYKEQSLEDYLEKTFITKKQKIDFILDYGEWEIDKRMKTKDGKFYYKHD